MLETKSSHVIWDYHLHRHAKGYKCHKAKFWNIDRYDTDMQLRPFYEDEISEEAFISMNEEAHEVLVLNTTPYINTKKIGNSNCAASKSSTSEIEREDVTEMKVDKLRIELGK